MTFLTFNLSHACLICNHLMFNKVLFLISVIGAGVSLKKKNYWK